MNYFWLWGFGCWVGRGVSFVVYYCGIDGMGGSEIVEVYVGEVV